MGLIRNNMLLELTTVDKPVNLNPTDYLFLVEAISHKFRTNNKEKIKDTEIYSLCCEELLIAIKSFNPLVSADPARFIYRALRNRIIEYLRYNKRKKRAAEFEILSEDIIFEDKGFSVSSLPKDILNNLFDGICEDDILFLADVQNKKLSIISEELGVSRVTVYNRVKKIVEKIRQLHPEIIEEFGGIINVD